MKIVLVGIQGAGKSTQGNLLSSQLGVPYLSTGHILREIAKEKTRLGRYIKETINAGILVPDDKMISIVDEYLTRKEYARGYILDGFPRTLKQAKEFKNHIDKVVYLNLTEKEALWRISYRNDSMREDETVAILRKRIQLFNKHTMPVIDYYKSKRNLVDIDATKSIKEVNKEILKSFGKQIVKNQIKSWQKKQKTIIAIVGLAGSGKTESADFFKEKGLPVVSFGKIINDYVDKKNLPHIEEVHKKIREEIRQKYGKEAVAILNKEKIENALKNSEVVVIDGMYSWEEYVYLKKEFPSVKIYILAIYADKNIRYKRVAKRKYRTKLFGEVRDINELVGTNKGAPIAFADFLIKNNFSIDEFHDKLEGVYRTVYFS